MYDLPMSEEEKFKAVGKLALERAEAKRQRALLAGKIQDYGVRLSYIGTSCKDPEDVRGLAKSMSGLDYLIGEGGLESVKAAIEQFSVAAQRVKDLDARAHDVGID